MMTTRPHHDPASIALDGRRVLGAAREDQAVPDFAARVGARELDTFEANLAALERGDGARTVTLHDQVAAGAHSAQARAHLFATLRDVRDDAALKLSDGALRHAFGVGATPSPGSTAEVKHAAEGVLAAAAAHATEAAQLGLDAAGVHALEEQVHALDGTDLAHVQSAQGRHAQSTATDSLAHLVSAESAHIRLAARRVFRSDETKQARYASTLPRHEVQHRAKPAAKPA